MDKGASVFWKIMLKENWREAWRGQRYNLKRIGEILVTALALHIKRSVTRQSCINAFGPVQTAIAAEASLFYLAYWTDGICLQGLFRRIRQHDPSLGMLEMVGGDRHLASPRPRNPPHQ